MKSRIALLIALFLIAALSSANALAQTAAHFTIPFAFTANHQTLAPGEYRVQLQFGHPILTLLNTQTGESVFVLVHFESGSRMETQGTLVFSVNGSDYSLQEARLPGTSLRGTLPVPRVYELRTAWNQPPTPPTVEIASR